MTELTRRQGYVEFGSSEHLDKENTLLRKIIAEKDAIIKELREHLARKPRSVFVEKEENRNPPWGM